MKNKKYFFGGVIGILLLLLLIRCTMGSVWMKQNYNKQVSVFSWYFELLDEKSFDENVQVLKEMKVTRVYQLLAAEQLEEPEVEKLVSGLADEGIELLLLTGDRSWVADGLAEFNEIVDALYDYNNRVEDTVQIKSVVLDVEVHTLPEWNEKKQELFEEYVQLMKEAKIYANAHNLKVVQVIPTHYDEVDEKLFHDFLQNGCDELSIMNYNRAQAMTAIETEVELCGEYGIFVESILETMPLNDEQGVTKDLTYYYDGLDILGKDVKKMKKVYGPDLGIAYHHYGTLSEMMQNR